MTAHSEKTIPRIPVFWLALMVLVLPAMALAASPATPQPAVGLSGEITPAPAAGNQYDPAIARGGDGYLAVWADNRSSFFDASGDAGTGTDVYAARLDAAGNLIDTTPIVLASGAADQDRPSLCWNGENWLVLWVGTIPHGFYYTRSIEAKRVSPAGEVLDLEPMLIWEGGDSNEHLFGVASNGEDWALVIVDVYQDGLNTRTRLLGRRVTPDGTIINAPYSLFSPSCCYFFYHGGLAYADGVYMAVFEGYVSGSEYGIFSLRLSDSLQTLDGYPEEIVQIAMQNETHFYRTPNIVSNGNQFFVGWQLYDTGGSSRVYGARVTTDGQSLDGDGLPISGPLPLSLDLSPQLAWDGTQWLVGWPDGSLNLARVSVLGGISAPAVPLPGIAEAAFVGAGSGGFQIVWPEDRVGGPLPLDLYTARLSAELTPGDEQVIALGAPHQTEPDVVPGGDGYMLVYRSDVSGESRIMARAVDLGGEPLAAEPTQLATGSVDLPRIAFAGENYLAVWSDTDGGAVVGIRLDAEGATIDAEPFAILDGREGDVAAQAGIYFVTALQGSGAAARVFGARVLDDGTVVDTSPLTLSLAASVGPRVGRIGESWMAVWEQTGEVDGSEIFAARVETDGVVVPGIPITFLNDGYAHHRPAIADGDTALVVWEDPRGGADEPDLYGRRLRSNLGSVDPVSGMALVVAEGAQTSAAVAWDGSNYLTAFTDNRAMENAFDARTDVYRDWIGPFAEPDEPAGVTLFADSVPEIDPAVAGRTDNALYVAAVFDPATPFAAYRLRLRAARVPTAVGEGSSGVPSLARLLPPYPNPANPAVKIRFALPRAGAVAVEIHDVQGHRVRTLRGEFASAGTHELLWNGEDMAGRPLPSGTYLLRVLTADGELSGKVSLVR